MTKQEGRLRNPATRRVMYDYLALRDGEKCALCGVSGQEVALVIDHKDGDTLNWSYENLRLLCRSCNNPLKWLHQNRQIGVTPENVCESENGNVVVRSERGLMLAEASAEIRLNRVSEPEFRRWLKLRLLGEERVLLSDAIRGGAEHCGVSTVTARRYLEKLLSSVGCLFVFEKTWVMFRPEYLAHLGESAVAKVDGKSP